MSSAPRFAPSSLNCTPAIVPLSEAFALTFTDAETVEPAAGEVIETVGGVVSAAAVALASLPAGPTLPAASSAVDLVVVGPGGETRVRVTRAGRLRDPVRGRGREAGRRATVDVVARDDHVVGRGTPRQGRSGRGRPWRVSVPGADGATVSGELDRRVHVGLDLGCAEGAVVDPHLVDQPVEPLAPDRVAADLDRRGRGEDRAADGELGDLGAVDVEALGGAVVSGGEMRPERGRDQRRCRRAAAPWSRS